MSKSNRLYQFCISGTNVQLSRFWDAVHHYADYSRSRVSVVESSVDQTVYVREHNKDLFECFIKASGLSCQGINNAVGISSLQEFMDFMMRFLHLGTPRGNICIVQTHEGAYIASVKFKEINGAVLIHADFHKPAGVEQTAMREDNGEIILVFKFQNNRQTTEETRP